MKYFLVFTSVGWFTVIRFLCNQILH